MQSDEEKIIQEKKSKLLKESETPEDHDKSNGEPLHFNSEEFYETLQNTDKPVLVDFWAEWCAPCRMMAPIVEDLAEEFAGEAVVGKLDLERGNNKEIAQKYQVSGIPTFIIFKDGEPVERLVGARRKEAFVETLQKYV